MSKRLVKVAKELNVGTKTIVEFLNGKGFEVSNKPTAKVSDEMYQVLAENFKGSIAIKEKANKISIGNRKKEEEKKKTKSWEVPTEEVAPKPVQKTTEPKKEVEEVKEEEVIAEKEPVKKEEEPKVTSKRQLKGPKILGTINLDDTRKSKRRNAKKETPKKETPKKEKETPVVKKQDEPKKEEVKPIVQKKQEEPTPKPEEKKVEPTPTAKEPTETKPVEEKGVLKTAKKAEVDIKVDAPQLKGLKIKGTINLSAFNKKRKKKDKSKDKKSDASGSKDKNLVASSDNNAKKRRKRKRVVSNDSNNRSTTTNNNSNTSNTNNKSKSTDSKPSNDRNSSKKVRKKGKRKEVNKKEVDNKLKDTLNRLQGGAGKKKRFGTSRKERDEQRKERLKEMEEKGEETPKLKVTEFITVSELAVLMGISATDIIMAAMSEKRMVSINQRMDMDLIELMGLEFGFEIEFISAEDQMEKELNIEEEDMEDDTPRAPIVTVMGHVDHGKTSLLDSIRKAKVADGEAGGITQHIGAYEVAMEDGSKITFLDTPGHEAFTAMRARGAKVTDIAVIIIAADDSIMPQTKEAISHAQAAEVPIIFAINKIDKEGANPERIKQELATMNLLVEEWGGKYQSQDISAKKGLNIDELLEKILLEAEMLELKANPEKRAMGTVLEASLEKGRGYVAKILVQNGTLSIGDAMIAGSFNGKVKAMFNERGKRIKTAGPATPVLVLGLQGAPPAGEVLNVMPSEKEAKELASRRATLVRQQQIRATRRVTLGDITNRIKIGNFQELNLIVKGDFDGSVEALSDALLKLSTEQVQTNIIHKAVGPITESDVNLAAASDAIVVGFQVRPNPMAKRLAEQEGIELKTYSVIYDAIDEIKSALEGLLEPKEVEEVTGMVEIQQVFTISKVGTVAGCLVQEGKIFRNSYIRIIRDGIVVYPKKEGVHGELSTLRRFKDNVAEVKNGMECGLTIKNFNDIKEGDMVEAYEIKEVKQKL
jgi:translation initiation factor IF-2